MSAHRSFARTAKALVIYDAASDAMDACPGDSSDAEAFVLIGDYDAALALVAEAFAADTADINPNGVGPFQHNGDTFKFARRMVIEASAQVAQ